MQFGGSFRCLNFLIVNLKQAIQSCNPDFLHNPNPYFMVLMGHEISGMGLGKSGDWIIFLAKSWNFVCLDLIAIY